MMKKFFTLLLLTASIGLYAQAPVNDDCSGLIDLGVAPACPDTVFYTNVNATASDIGFGNSPTCFNGGTVQNDVWFAFTTSDTILNYTITVTGITDGQGSEPLVNPQIAIYRGDCEFDGLAELFCASAELGENILEIDAEGLTPNVTYFIRVNDYSSSATPNWGSFQLCVAEQEPINTIDEGSSNDCFGELYDSGGPDGDYQNDENYVFTICPEPSPSPPSCITFTLEYYNFEYIEFGTTDQLIFYDGDQPNPNNIIANIGGGNFAPNVAGGGGVCFQVQATSGCMTVEFTSNGSVAFEGFAGYWECSYNQDCDPYDPITVETGVTTDQIEDFVASPQTVVTVTDINCPERAYGLFEAGDDTDLGLERGLLLTTGDVNWAPGPNTSGGGGNPNANNSSPGDAELDSLSIYFGDGDLSNDACVIEMDVLAATNELEFEYIFGSDEYPEFVNDFNDIFAFLISGPGIVGEPFLNGQRNIAVLPDGSNTLVEINSVNNVLNWEYYRNNQLGQSVEYDGLTSDYLGIKKSLTARAQVVPCSTYHLKLAIADRQDFVYDSGVFISEIRGGTPDLTVQFNSGIDYLIEDCTNTPDEVLVRLDTPLEDPISYAVVIGGTAVRGIDYELTLPDTIFFAAGQQELTFPIVPLSDMETEEIETIEISLVNDFGCGEITYAELTIDLHDELNVEILLGQDTALVCQDSAAFLEATGAATYFWTPVSIIDNPTSPNPIATPTQSTWVRVEGNVGICVDIDSIYLDLISPFIEIGALDPTAICQGDSVRFKVIDNANNSNLAWTPVAGLNDPNSPEAVATPEVTTTYTATIDIFGCQVSDTVTVDVSPFEFPLIANDTTICENYSVQLAEEIITNTTTYAWTPEQTLSDPLSSGPIATPDETTTYQLIAISSNEACADTAEVTVTVLPADLDIQNPDTTEICLDETVTLNALLSVPDSTQNLLWTPANGTLSDTVGTPVVATPQVSQWYYATFGIGACTVFDSVYVRVDSLPQLELTVDPEKDVYCTGEIVQITSQIYEPGFYPDIEHLWLPNVGYETPDSNWNMVITTQDTTTYFRVTNNRACVDTAAITLNVFRPPTVAVIPADTSICIGESVQLQFVTDGEEPESLEWSPASGISCTDCPDPVVTPQMTTTYTVMTEYPACPPSASATITVVGPPVVSLNPNTLICEGESIQLNLEADEISTYTWSSPDIPGFTSNDPLLVVSPTVTTTYNLIAENDEGCPPVEVSIAVVVINEPNLSVSNDTLICGGEPLTLTAESDLPPGLPESYTWEYNGQTSEGPVLNIASLPGSTEFTLTYSYGPGCGTLTQTVFAEVDELILIDSLIVTPLEFDSTLMIPGGEPFNIDAFVTPPDGDFTYEWTWDVDGRSEVLSNGTNLPEQTPPAGQITYFFLAETAIGCPFEASITVDIIPPIFEMPNAFTPNGDGTNDFFYPVSFGVFDIVEFKIYNRWGQLVYDNDDPTQGWDGTYNGDPAPSDVYVYTIVVESIALPGALRKTGDVTLLR